MKNILTPPLSSIHIRDEENHKINVLYWLNRLEAKDNHGDDNLYFIAYLKREMLMGGLTYEDIGRTEKHIRKLYVKGCKRKAEGYLTKLKSNESPFDSLYVALVFDSLREGNLTPKKVGMTKKKLNKFRTRAKVRTSP